MDIFGINIKPDMMVKTVTEQIFIPFSNKYCLNLSDETINVSVAFVGPLLVLRNHNMRQTLADKLPHTTRLSEYSFNFSGLQVSFGVHEIDRKRNLLHIFPDFCDILL